MLRVVHSFLLSLHPEWFLVLSLVYPSSLETHLGLLPFISNYGATEYAFSLFTCALFVCWNLILHHDHI